MEALVANRGALSRAYNIASGKSVGPGVTVKRIPIPKTSLNQILVKVHSVALNPIDVKGADLLAPRDSVLGCDYAGIVTSVGNDAPGNWEVGDRVAGFLHGGHYIDRGSFAEYLPIDGDLAWKMPEGTSFDEACTFGVPAVTAVMALNVHLGLPWIDDTTAKDSAAAKSQNDSTVLIYSGSTAVGLFAIQVAKRSGFKVVTTASPRSFDLVKSYGADSVFDYRSSTAIEDIIKAHPTITQALDCISEGNSTDFCAKVIKKNGGKVVTLFDKGKSRFAGVEYLSMMVFTAFGESFALLPPLGPKLAGSAFDREALVRFYGALPGLFGELKPPPIKVIGKGYENIILGLGKLRLGKVSGQKLVVNL